MKLQAADAVKIVQDNLSRITEEFLEGILTSVKEFAEKAQTSIAVDAHSNEEVNAAVMAELTKLGYGVEEARAFDDILLISWSK